MSVKKYADFITEQHRKLAEAAKKGSTRYGESGMNTSVIHNDGKGNHLSMTYHNEEPGAVTFHGNMHGHKIRFNSEGEHGGDPTSAHVRDDLKATHPNLPAEVHKAVAKHAVAGIKKHLGGGEE